MAESTQLSTLKSNVIRYLQVCESLGQRELVLEHGTLKALHSLKLEVIPDMERAVLGENSTTVSKEQMPLARAETDANSPGLPVSDVSGMSKIDALESIREEILSDTALPKLFKRAQNMVFGVGDPDAKIMFIGEAPGADEDCQGLPFVGAAGQLLNKMIAAMGLQRDEVYISNVVKYRPDMPEGSRGNRKPTPEELECCRPHILRQIRVIHPRVIVGLGATAMEGLLNQHRISITQIRGQWHEVEGIAVMPTFHPAYLLHNDSVAEKRKVWEDLLSVMERVEMPISDKQRRYFRK